MGWGPHQRIYKYALLAGDGRQRVEMPKGASVVAVQSQHEKPTLWALCPLSDDVPEKVVRTFYVYRTGTGVVPMSQQHVGTVQIGVFVWHVFEEA